MAIVYFDASAFVKLLVDEDGTDVAVDLWDGCDLPVSSRLSYPEVRAALAAATPDHRLDQLDEVEREWEEYWQAVAVVELTPSIGRHAGELTREHALRGADGVHLASVLALADVEPIVAVWDQRLQAGAVAASLRVAPAPNDT